MARRPDALSYQKPVRLVQPFPPGMVAPRIVKSPQEPGAGRATLMARIARLPPHSRHRRELEARLRDLTCRLLESEVEARP